ncbi:xanthine dehydrogenase family protein molybdopterin-binding subunit [Bradyrhizobium sp. AUGA SZCCT0182]|uniref:xanthine dehydrogenase family protein molybdopterin-binding subunit n=1 Tax=Bradyrhizobium sp. AUGA SZCCT0182 TaxID=2807667 RepID=UPI001BA93C49|nr:xanthine dehydrogenase family protein molybdopterin-binding subunit [Bradyrhizobium sp. AUGA SZCCT0182]MBR1231747.1 xanthine dehydrogenase family protein molybdopterin-binding subunit [Bradyrhizobium sp. AUGA SZCCT0182]
MMKSQRAIGSSRPRAEAKVLVRGQGQYLDDVDMPGLLHIAFLRSPYPHAGIGVINVAAAQALDGVVKVVTWNDLSPICKGWETSQTYAGLLIRLQTALADSKVVFVGQPVVAVVAETRAIAEDAIELIEVEWNPEPAACELDQALTEGSATAHTDLKSNLAYHAKIGDPISPHPFETAEHVLEESFSFNRLTGCSMETRGVVASYLESDESLTVYQSHTAPHQLRSLYSMHLGLDEGRIRVICPHVGGSFGVKIHLYADEIATVATSRLIGKPIKFIADRMESFVSDIHAREQKLYARLALDGEGHFLAWEAHCRLAIGPFSTHPGSSVQEGDEALRVAMAPYVVPYVSGELDVVFQNKTMVGQYRGVGHPMAVAITEFMIDQAAARLGVEPAELRLKNFIPDDSYPSKTRTGVDLDALSHEKCMNRLLELVELPTLRAENARLRNEGIYRGFGFATFVERTATNAPMSAHIRKATAQDGVTLTIDPSGAVRCSISVTDQGQGTHAVLSQILSDALGVPPERVKIVSGDSQATPYGSGVRASRGTPVGGELALQAGRELREVVLKAAGQLLQTQPEALDIQDGIIAEALTGSPSISLADLAEIIYFKPQLLPKGPQISLSLSKHLGHDWPALVPTNGIQASLVEVDVKTGFVRLLKHWAVDDFGTVVNPLLVSEQVRGGIAQGIGQALFEELVYSEDGQLLNGTFADYFIPLAADLPDVIVEHVETPWPHTALGAKGAGEAGATGAVGAVLNAVNDAIRPLGAKITEVPMTPARILKALGRL